MPRRCHPAGPWRHALELYEITNTNEVPQPLGIFGRHTDAAVTDSGLILDSAEPVSGVVPQPETTIRRQDAA